MMKAAKGALTLALLLMGVHSAEANTVERAQIAITTTLVGGETNVGALAEAAGISESAVSHHMRSLRQLRMVRARKEGRQVFYALEDQHIIDLFSLSRRRERLASLIEHGGGPVA